MFWNWIVRSTIWRYTLQRLRADSPENCHGWVSQKRDMVNPSLALPHARHECFNMSESKMNNVLRLLCATPWKFYRRLIFVRRPGGAWDDVCAVFISPSTNDVARESEHCARSRKNIPCCMCISCVDTLSCCFLGFQMIGFCGFY